MRMFRSLILALVPALVILTVSIMLPGCATDKATQSSAATSGTAINSMCVCGKPVDGKTYTTYNGQKIGFCCQKCLDGFNAMTDAQKKDAVAKLAKADHPKSDHPK